MNKPFLKEIILTGGRCGGKSTAMQAIKQRFGKDSAVYLVPEVATDLVSMGWDLAGRNGVHVQKWIMEEQLKRREQVLKLADIHMRYSTKPVLIVYDRFIQDSRAFLAPGTYDALLEDMKLSRFDASWFADAVIHMQTAAVGTPYYNLESNAARSGSTEEAIKEDEALIDAYIDHPHFRFVGNPTVEGTSLKAQTSSLHRKIDVVADHVEHLISGEEIEKKFLVELVDASQEPIHLAQIQIEQFYPKERIRLARRTRSQDGREHRQVTKTHKLELDDMRRLETETSESELLWDQWRNEAYPQAPTVRKTRINFLWNGRFYELDRFGTAKYMLEVELTSPDEQVEIPPLLKVIEDVSTDPQYKNESIAKYGFPQNLHSPLSEHPNRQSSYKSGRNALVRDA